MSLMLISYLKYNNVKYLKQIKKLSLQIHLHKTVNEKKLKFQMKTDIITV